MQNKTISIMINKILKIILPLNKTRLYSWIMGVISAFASIFILFVIVLNINPNFAQTTYTIPVVGNICRIFTFVKYDLEDEIKKIDVKIPNIAIEGKSEFEKRLNNEIITIIKKEQKEAELRADEYYQAYIQTGGNKKEYIPVKITIDYNVKYLNNKFASFMIYKYETVASAYATTHYYNIDLEEGKKITLKTIFGEDYIKYVSKQINNKIKNTGEEEKKLYFNFVDIEQLINEDTKFYITDNGKRVVIVFDKYDIAVGIAGNPEFVIQ